MNKPVCEFSDQITQLLGIRTPKKSQRKIINSLVRLVYFIDRKDYFDEFKSCPLSKEEISILTVYYYRPRQISEILVISDRALRNRMAKIRKKLSVNNNIEAICIARENYWMHPKGS